MKTCYLAGPISGLEFDQAQDWRAIAARRLADHGIIGLSPLRAKEYLRGTGVLPVDGFTQPLSTSKGITTRDRFDCTRSDAVLVNLVGARAVSIGTMIELGWADSARNPVILAMEPEGNPHAHAMVREIAGFVVPTVEEAVELAIAILTGGARG